MSKKTKKTANSAHSDFKLVTCRTVKMKSPDTTILNLTWDDFNLSDKNTKRHKALSVANRKRNQKRRRGKNG